MGTELPASFEAAWGRGARPSKGPKPGLSLKRIVHAAVDVASAEGLSAVSMSRIASELGAAPMSLYRYLAAKDELLALMVDAAFETLPSAPVPNEAWRAGLSRWAREHLGVLRRYPWVVRIPITGPPVTPNRVLWFERGLACLGGTSLSENEKISVLLLVNGFVRNDALLTSDLRIAAGATGSAVEIPSYGRLLSGLVDPQRFPALSGAIAAGAFNGPDDPDAEFNFGLGRILDGVTALLAKAALRDE